MCELRRHICDFHNLNFNIRFISFLASLHCLFIHSLLILRLCGFMCVCVRGFVYTCEHYRGTTQAAVFFELINMLVLSSEAYSDLHSQTTDHKSDEKAYCAINTHANNNGSFLSETLSDMN